jgi:hypothetical protein
VGVQGSDHLGVVVDGLKTATASSSTWVSSVSEGPIEGEWMDK